MSLLKTHPPKAVFFDWDGTLADSFDFLLGVHHHVCQKLDRPAVTAEEFKHYFGYPRDVVYGELYGSKKKRAMEMFADYILNPPAGVGPVPINGAQDLLLALKKADVFMGIVSNKRADFIVRELEGFNWSNYIGFIVGAGDAAEDKPSPAPLIRAIEQTIPGADPSEIWFVGDTDNDLLCAQSVGSVNIFLEGHHRAAEWIKTYKPDFVFRDCAALTAAL